MSLILSRNEEKEKDQDEKEIEKRAGKRVMPRVTGERERKRSMAFVSVTPVQGVDFSRATSWELDVV